MNADIEQFVKQCSVCQTYQNRNPRQPLLPHSRPNASWKKLGADIVDFGGIKWLVIVDYYSNWIEVEKLNKGSESAKVIQKLQSVFSRWGVPLELVTDNGPQFSSWTFDKFACDFDFIHTASDPIYSHSNGLAEKAVGNVKKYSTKNQQKEGYM